MRKHADGNETVQSKEALAKTRVNVEDQVSIDPPSLEYSFWILGRQILLPSFSLYVACIASA